MEASKKDHPAEVTITPEKKIGDFKGNADTFVEEGHASMKFVAHVTDDK